MAEAPTVALTVVAVETSLLLYEPVVGKLPLTRLTMSPPTAPPCTLKAPEASVALVLPS